MKKIHIKISNMSSQQYGNTPTRALPVPQDALKMKDSFKILKKDGYLLTSVISALLMLLISITGCSDVPYSGPVLTAGHVDQYLNTIEQDTVCLQDGFDTVCVKLLLDKTEIDTTNIDYMPVVHVHPTNIVYVFDYQGQPILEAKRLMDTTQVIQGLVAAGRAQLPSNLNNLNNRHLNYVPESWVIEIYYPDTFRQANRGWTPETSGLDIRVVAGTVIPISRRTDLEIIDFTQIDRYDGRRGVQFSLETQAPQITIQVIGVVPGNTATFYINTDSVESGDNTNILRLRPL